MLVRLIIATEKPPLQGRLRQLLNSPDLLVTAVKGKANLWEGLAQESFDLLLVSRRLLPDPPQSVVDSVRMLPDSPDVIVLTRRDDEEDRAQLLTAGCLAVLSTELPNGPLSEALASMIERRRSRRTEEISAPDTITPRISSFVSASPAMTRFMELVRKVTRSSTSLLITGETGVGKEWLARAIHAESPRAPGPFVAVNCGALPEALLESELFGHEEGAFTGATRVRRGMFELAHGGTIFLDEIGEMVKQLQVKLLRVLQSKEIQRVGAESVIEVDVRVVAATNRDLTQDVEDGTFRRDLFYRLSVVTLEVPPLRERREDIRELLRSYLASFQVQIPSEVDGFTDAAMQALVDYAWPGNVRELINVVERALLLTEGTKIGTGDLPEAIAGPAAPDTVAVSGEAEPDGAFPAAWLELPLKEVRERVTSDIERRYLTALLEATGGKMGETAARAGIDPRSLYDKMKRLGLRKEDFKRRPAAR